MIHMLVFWEAITQFVGNWIGQEWSYLRGGLTTVDRDYGWINNIHHDIGTHVIHHLFPQIPHYNLVQAVHFFSPSRTINTIQLLLLFYLLQLTLFHATFPLFFKRFLCTHLHFYNQKLCIILTSIQGQGRTSKKLNLDSISNKWHVGWVF